MQIKEGKHYLLEGIKLPFKVVAIDKLGNVHGMIDGLMYAYSPSKLNVTRELDDNEIKLTSELEEVENFFDSHQFENPVVNLYNED